MRIDFKPLTSSLTHVALPPRSPSLVRPPLLVLLHGRGADEYDLIPVTHYLDARFFIISVRAPQRFSHGGHTWYEMTEDGKPDPGEFQSSFDALASFLDAARVHYPVADGPFFLFGFSMGAMMALAYTLSIPSAVRAVAAHSGYLPDEQRRPYRWGDLAHLSMYIAHGTNDPVVPVQKARASYDLLGRTAAAVTYKEYPIQHQVSEQSIADIDEFYRKILGPPLRVQE